MIEITIGVLAATAITFCCLWLDEKDERKKRERARRCRRNMKI